MIRFGPLIMKVGATNGRPLIPTAVVCDRLPLMPVILIWNVVVPLNESLTVSCDRAVPLPWTCRTTGLIPTPNPAGGGEIESVTFPKKPFTPVTLMVANPEEPAVMVRLDGKAVIVKSGPAAGETLPGLLVGTAKTRLARRRKREKATIGAFKNHTFEEL